jgi:hypothetical protein
MPQPDDAPAAREWRMTAADHCLASRAVLDGAPVGLMYRERPFATEDSGWRFFAGDEDGGYVADPRNVPFVPLADVLAGHPEIAPWLELPRGTALERDVDGVLAPAAGTDPHAPTEGHA